MSKMLHIPVLVLFLLFGTRAVATHIVGGELYYDCLGNGQYRLTLKLYRDCNNGQAPFDDPANISIFSAASNQLIQNISIPFPGSSNVPFTTSNPCFQAPPNVCVEEAVYTIVVTLPENTNPAGLIMAYQRCCRNNTILNISDPGGTGSTYAESTPPSAIAPCNSSPRFDNFPPIALCVGDSLIFDHSATDPDGDSLVYELCTSNAGANSTNPMPVPTSNPPFPPIIYLPPYTAASPIASSPPININPVTGILKVYPTQQGQFVVAVCVKEYRNGVYIGTHTRDFQFNVTVCQSNVQAGFGLPPTLVPNAQGVFTSCGDFLINFNNTSQNASLFSWDFGDLSTTSDTSTLSNPTWLYADTGVYRIRLIANPGYFCADTAFLTIVIRPDILPVFADPGFQCIDNNTFAFNGSGSYTSSAQFLWLFGANASPPTATTANVPSVSWDSAGSYPISFIVNDFGCTDTAKDTVIIYGKIDIDWVAEPPQGCIPFKVDFFDSSNVQNVPVQYLWDFGDGQTTGIINPSHVYTQPGQYTVSLTLTDPSGCNDTLRLERPNYITANPLPTAGFSFTPDKVSVFEAKIVFTDESQDATSSVLILGDGTVEQSTNIVHEYMDGGIYDVTQIVFNGFGCSDTAVKQVTILPEYTLYVPNTFTVNGDDTNEEFRAKGVGIVAFQMQIFNRWGEILFQSDSIKQTWNGRRNNQGAVLPQGIYVYKITVTNTFGMEIQYWGNINLIR